MKPPICVKCQIQLRQIKTGISVIDMFLRPPRPYQIWRADLFECPICKVQIVSGFADSPIGRHFEANFARLLRMSGKGFQTYNYEHVADAVARMCQGEPT